MASRKSVSKSYFDAHRKDGSAWAGYWNHDYRYTIEAVRGWETGSLIDIGCGTGAFLAYAAVAVPGLSLFGLDLSSGMVREARARLGERATVYQGDSERMPLEDSRFDAVTCHMSIHHYPDAQAAVSEMRRILKPGGMLCINDMDCIAPVRAVANIIFPHLKSGDVKMYKRSEIEGMASAAGFERIEYRKVSPFSFLCIAQA